MFRDHGRALEALPSTIVSLQEQRGSAALLLQAPGTLRCGISGMPGTPSLVYGSRGVSW